MIDKWQKRMEKVTANAVFRALQKQKRDFQQYLRNNGIPDDGILKVVLNHSGNAVVDGFISRVKTTINRSYTDAGKKWPKQPEGLDFNLPTRPESIYLRSLRDLHLSQRKGSISATTEERVKKLVTSGIKKWQSAKEIANNIEKLDPQVFSKNRADLIAINQIGKAKQFGEFTAMKEFHDAGYVVLKYWSTVNDSRVTRTHTANQWDGWIFQDKTFSWTGDLIPPASDNPRCRCACLYDIGDLKGRKQPKSIEQKIKARENREIVLDIRERIINNYSNYSRDILEVLLESDKIFPMYAFSDIPADNLEKNHIAALYSYTGGWYYEINKVFRSWEINSLYARMAVELEDALNSLPNFSGVVYRGIAPWKFADKIKNLKEWEIFSDLGFMSTSRSLKVAKEYAENNGVIIKFVSKTGKVVEDFWILAEEEVLHIPWKTLIFQRKYGNIYEFIEI